jgi:hypothetical protein
MKKFEFYKHYIVLVFFLITLSAKAQEVKVRGGFFADSVGIGEPVKFYLTATYPSKLNLLFPDSAYQFSPFEFESKKYFPTHTNEGISYDSVIYNVSTFEIEKIQSLSLPVYVVSQTDSVEFASTPDSIRLVELVGTIPDSIPVEKLPLKVNTTYHEVPTNINYIILSIVAAVVLVVALVVFLVFGKRIRKHYQVKRLTKYHAQFLEAYKTQVDQIRTSFSAPVSETALGLWKKYMEQLLSRPYTKLTTREMLHLEKDEKLASNLHTIDKAIYGHDTEVVESFESLRDYAATKFVKRLEELKHG